MMIQLKGGTNLFPEIDNAQPRCNIGRIDLSIKNPQLTFGRTPDEREEFLNLRESRIFSQRFVKANVPRASLIHPKIDYLPISDYHSIVDVVFRGCNLQKDELLGTTFNYNYLTVKNQQAKQTYTLPTNVKNAFLFGTGSIEKGTKCLGVDYPNSLPGQIASYGWWNNLCKYCAKNGIAIFNYNAYQVMSYREKSTPLSEVAIKFPELSWGEFFPTTTSCQAGIMVGSSKFVADIKENVDDDIETPLFIGDLIALETNRESIRKFKRKQLDILLDILSRHGMKTVMKPKAGNSILCRTPCKAFGEKCADSKSFNKLMCDKAGIIGSPRGPNIAYSTIEGIETTGKKIEWLLADANILY